MPGAERRGPPAAHPACMSTGVAAHGNLQTQPGPYAPALASSACTWSCDSTCAQETRAPKLLQHAHQLNGCNSGEKTEEVALPSWVEKKASPACSSGPSRFISPAPCGRGRWQFGSVVQGPGLAANSTAEGSLGQSGAWCTCAAPPVRWAWACTLQKVWLLNLQSAPYARPRNAASPSAPRWRRHAPAQRRKPPPPAALAGTQALQGHGDEASLPFWEQRPSSTQGAGSTACYMRFRRVLMSKNPTPEHFSSHCHTAFMQVTPFLQRIVSHSADDGCFRPRLKRRGPVHQSQICRSARTPAKRRRSPQRRHLSRLNRSAARVGMAMMKLSPEAVLRR